MSNELNTLMDKLSVPIADNRLVEVSLSPVEAMMAGFFIEEAISADDAAESILSGEASHG